MSDLIAETNKKIKDSGRPIIASVSGGKDSIAMALWLKENGFEETNDVHYVWADTGWEHPVLYEYIEKTVKPLLGDRFHRVVSAKFPGGMVDAITKFGAFPTRQMRWCTRYLKKEPIKAYIKSVGNDPLPVNAVGIRAAESKARSKMDLWEPGSIFGTNVCDTWRPLISWVVQDVVDIHKRHDLRPCPLYLKDKYPSERVGCWPCIMSKKSEIRAMVETDPGRLVQIRQLEEKVSEIAEERYREKGETFESLGLKKPGFFQAKTGGTGECWPIDKVAKWAKTERGGHQYGLELFLPSDPSERGCQMWGLCDVPDENGEFSE